MSYENVTYYDGGRKMLGPTDTERLDYYVAHYLSIGQAPAGWYNGHAGRIHRSEGDIGELAFFPTLREAIDAGLGNVFKLTAPEVHP